MAVAPRVSIVPPVTSTMCPSISSVSGSSRCPLEASRRPRVDGGGLHGLDGSRGRDADPAVGFALGKNSHAPPRSGPDPALHGRSDRSGRVDDDVAALLADGAAQSQSGEDAVAAPFGYVDQRAFGQVDQ